MQEGNRDCKRCCKAESECVYGAGGDAELNWRNRDDPMKDKIVALDCEMVGVGKRGGFGKWELRWNKTDSEQAREMHWRGARL